MTEELNEFQICWCVIVALALATVFLDIFFWRA